MDFNEYPQNISRREFLNAGMTTLLIFGGFACATTDSRQLGQSTASRESEQRDKAVDNIFLVNLAVKRNERVLVFTDDYKYAVANEAEYVAKRGSNYCAIAFQKYLNTGESGAEPPKSLWEVAFGKHIVKEIESKYLMKKVLDKKINPEEFKIVYDIVKENKKDVINAVIALAWFSTSHTSFRRLLTDAAGVRYASMPGFDPRMWQTAMSANWEEVDRQTLSLKNKLAGAISAHVRTPKGTDIVFDLKGREWFANTSLINQPGSWGNLPAGELAIPPIEDKTTGKMVIEAIRGAQGRAVFEIQNGKVIKMNGDFGYTSFFETNFQKYPLARYICEFGIGTNEKAKPGTTMLELEKILGTIHIALGDNIGFGGKIQVPFHMDILFENPTVVFTFSDGRTLQILQDGKVLW
jgi:aminopeptidase